MKLIVASAFSTNMLKDDNTIVKFRKLTKVQAVSKIKAWEIESIIGHAGTADLLSKVFGKDIPANRVNFAWDGISPMLVVTPAVRLQEGQILTEEELGKIGISFILCTTTA